jgi:putative aldouronate transport system permease protein
MARYRAKRLSLFDPINGIALIFLTLLFFLPFFYVFMGSITSVQSYNKHGLLLVPMQITLDNYRFVLGAGSAVVQGLKITVFITVVGTVLNLVVTGCMAFGLSKKYLPGRTLFTAMVFITMLFGGGLIPTYLLVRGLGLFNSLWAIILPMLVNAFNMFIMRNFFMQLPVSLEESARIDGYGYFAIFFRIILPISKPLFATMALFHAVAWWNVWFPALLYITDSTKWPLQLVIRENLRGAMSAVDPREVVEWAKNRQLPPNVIVQMTNIMVTLIPIVMLYPFLQRYFVKGIIIGSIKG